MGEAAEAFGSEWLAALRESAAGIEAETDLHLLIEQVIEHEDNHEASRAEHPPTTDDGCRAADAAQPDGHSQLDGEHLHQDDEGAQPTDRHTRWTISVADGRVAVDGVTESAEDGPDGHGETPSSGTAANAEHRPTSDPMIRLSCDRVTAEGIHDGTISPSSAFLDGRLRISGDWRQLMANSVRLAAVARQLHR